MSDDTVTDHIVQAVLVATGLRLERVIPLAISDTLVEAAPV
jgi:hypothetical protein